MGNLKVADSEFLELASLYGELGEIIEEELGTYLSSISNLTGNAIQSGDIHKNLEVFENEAKVLKGQMEAITTLLKEGCKGFVESIDESDLYLYD